MSPMIDKLRKKIISGHISDDSLRGSQKLWHAVEIEAQAVQVKLPGWSKWSCC